MSDTHDIDIDVKDEVVFEQSVAGVRELYQWESIEDVARRNDEELQARSQRVELYRLIADLVEQEPLFPIPQMSSMNDGTRHWDALHVEDDDKIGDAEWQENNSWRERSVNIPCGSAEEMKAVIRILGSGVKDTDPFYGVSMRFTFAGIAFKAYRSDQQCEMIPVVDDEGNEVLEEITVRETIAPEKVREVIKQVPKMTKKCPPLIG